MAEEAGVSIDCADQHDAGDSVRGGGGKPRSGGRGGVGNWNWDFLLGGVGVVGVVARPDIFPVRVVFLFQDANVNELVFYVCSGVVVGGDGERAGRGKQEINPLRPWFFYCGSRRTEGSCRGYVT